MIPQQPQGNPMDNYFDEQMPYQQPNQNAELTRWQLESVEEIDSFKHSLRGEVWDETEKKWIEQPNVRMLNNQGVEILAAEIRDRVNKISTLSNLTADHIYNIISRFEINICRMLVKNFEEWEVKDIVFCYIIRDKCVEFIFIGLQRCESKTFLNFLERAKQYVEKKTIVGEERGRRFSPLG